MPLAARAVDNDQAPNQAELFGWTKAERAEAMATLKKLGGLEEPPGGWGEERTATSSRHTSPLRTIP